MKILKLENPNEKAEENPSFKAFPYEEAEKFQLQSSHQIHGNSEIRTTQIQYKHTLGLLSSFPCSHSRAHRPYYYHCLLPVAIILTFFNPPWHGHKKEQSAHKKYN